MTKFQRESQEQTVERVHMVQAMEYIMRNVNDETIFDSWLMLGVADGDIEYGDFTVPQAGYVGEDILYYCADDTFAELMELFLKCMKRAAKSGGLYCGGVTNHEKPKI